MSAKKIPKKTLSRRNSPTSSSETDAWFAPIIQAFHGNADVSITRMFGSVGLKINGEVFAIMENSALVIKLPKGYVDALISAALGEYFDPGYGRLMREWGAIKLPSGGTMAKLAKEALQFVVSGL